MKVKKSTSDEEYFLTRRSINKTRKVEIVVWHLKFIRRLQNTIAKTNR